MMNPIFGGVGRRGVGVGVQLSAAGLFLCRLVGCLRESKCTSGS